MEIRSLENKFSTTIRDIIVGNINLLPTDMFKIKLSTNHEDTNMSFDMSFGDVQVSVRLRDYKFREERYWVWDDVENGFGKLYPKKTRRQVTALTIRTRSKAGYKTEINKLQEGMGQLYLYGILNKEGDNIDGWWLIDINKVREHLLEGIYKVNPDGTQFRVYSHSMLERYGCIIKNNIKL